jgi:hypothetical protein
MLLQNCTCASLHYDLLLLLHYLHLPRVFVLLAANAQKQRIAHDDGTLFCRDFMNAHGGMAKRSTCTRA